jgi:hypothetical protein
MGNKEINDREKNSSHKTINRYKTYRIDALETSSRSPYNSAQAYSTRASEHSNCNNHPCGSSTRRSENQTYHHCTKDNFNDDRQKTYNEINSEENCCTSKKDRSKKDRRTHINPFYCFPCREAPRTIPCGYLYKSNNTGSFLDERAGTYCPCGSTIGCNAQAYVQTRGALLR